MNATVTKKPAKKSAVASKLKKVAPKPAAKEKTKVASRPVSKSPAKTVAAKSPAKKLKPVAKTAVKAAKPVTKPAKKAVTPVAKPAAKAVKTIAAQPAPKKALPAAKKSNSVTAEKTPKNLTKLVASPPAVPQKSNSPIVSESPKVTPKVIKPSVPMTPNNATAAITGKIDRIEVLKVSEVATKLSKKVSPVLTDGTLLTEAQILKMGEKDYMNDAQLAFFKARLQQLEKDLLRNAGETTEHLRETVLVPDPADRATIEEEHALELRTRDRERKLLKKVQQSINSIDANDYGWCEETGEPIGVPRLLARPTATLSLEAQQRRELKQKLYGD